VTTGVGWTKGRCAVRTNISESFESKIKLNYYRAISPLLSPFAVVDGPVSASRSVYFAQTPVHDLYLQDSPLGVRGVDFSTAFPTGINAAASFNRRLIRLRGIYMGREHVGKGVNIALGPMINMGRVAEGGRNWEGFGADPFLTGEAAYETILGMQQAGVIACAKHLVAK
jgi:hypothetical protein